MQVNPVNLPPPHRYLDRQFCTAMLLLLLAGVSTLYSLSFVSGDGVGALRFYRHCVYIALALLLFSFALSMPLHFWRNNMVWVLCIALLLCLWALLFAPSKGASRWVRVFGVSFQASEILKFGALLALAWWGRLIVENNALRGQKFAQLLRPMLPLALFLLLAVAVMILQKDLGMIVLLLLAAVVALMLAGLPARYIVLTIAVALVMIALLVWSEPYRIRRLLSFYDVFDEPLGNDYAQLQSLMAYANGGWLGVGFGGSLQKALLPEAHNDFIIAIIAEEHGLFGFFAVCAAYLFIVMRALAVGKVANARGEVFGAFYAYMLGVVVLAQVTINIGGSLAVMPSKGITLPLVSFGGSSMCITALMLGVLLRLDYENKCSRQEGSA